MDSEDKYTTCLMVLIIVFAACLITRSCTANAQTVEVDFHIQGSLTFLPPTVIVEGSGEGEPITEGAGEGEPVIIEGEG
ncbi:unnamed protein product, partial [marine sediment metagenome]